MREGCVQHRLDCVSCLRGKAFSCCFGWIENINLKILAASSKIIVLVSTFLEVLHGQPHAPAIKIVNLTWLFRVEKITASCRFIAKKEIKVPIW